MRGVTLSFLSHIAKLGNVAFWPHCQIGKCCFLEPEAIKIVDRAYELREDPYYEH